MIDNYLEVTKAHDSDDLLFGTVESWVAYVWIFIHPGLEAQLIVLFQM